MRTVISGAVFVLLVSFGCFCAMSEAAKPTKAQKAAHADKNDDGTVDKKEMKMEKEWEKDQKQQVNTWWEKQADTNKDGKVSGAEREVWKGLQKERIDLNGDGQIDAKERRLSWRHGKSKVNTDIEKKYDANADGWLEPAEVKQMLQDKQTILNTDGKAKVDTEIEQEYDANKDGVIDGKEAEDLKEDLAQ